MTKLSFEAFEKALFTLKEGLRSPPQNDLERDGVIQRFEYTFELSWKSIRKFLLHLGRTEVSASPKPLFRDALEEGLIENIEAWFGFLEARNLIAHTYNRSHADEVYKAAKPFSEKAEHLLYALKALEEK